MRERHARLRWPHAPLCEGPLQGRARARREQRCTPPVRTCAPQQPGPPLSLRGGRAPPSAAGPAADCAATWRPLVSCRVQQGARARHRCCCGGQSRYGDQSRQRPGRGPLIRSSVSAQLLPTTGSSLRTRHNKAHVAVGRRRTRTALPSPLQDTNHAAPAPTSLG